MRPEFDPNGEELFSFISNARRQQIKAAAVETIVEYGFANTSLAKIAKHAGISKGVISYHFAGKDELMEKLVVEFYLAAAREMIPKILAASTSREALAVYIRSNVEYIADNRTGILAVGDIIVNFRDAEGKLRFQPQDDGTQDMISSVVDILRAGQESGEFSSFDPWVVAASLRASIDMVSVRMAAIPDLDTTHYGEELVTIFDRVTRKEAQ